MLQQQHQWIHNSRLTHLLFFFRRCPHLHNNNNHHHHHISFCFIVDSRTITTTSSPRKRILATLPPPPPPTITTATTTPEYYYHWKRYLSTNSTTRRHHYFHHDTLHRHSSRSVHPRRWTVSSPSSSQLPIHYYRLNSTTIASQTTNHIPKESITSIFLRTNRCPIGPDVTSVRRTRTSRHNHNNTHHPTDRPIPIRPDISTTNMGIFRLLNDTQRTILSEQQQLTAQVVRIRNDVGSLLCFILI